MSNQHYNPYELLQDAYNRSSSVSEFTECLQVSTEFIKIMNQYEQRQQEEETNTKNSLLPTILKKRQELGISNSEPPFLKSMTVDELQLYFKELREQESSSIRLVS